MCLQAPATFPNVRDGCQLIPYAIFSVLCDAAGCPLLGWAGFVCWGGSCALGGLPPRHCTPSWLALLPPRGLCLHSQSLMFDCDVGPLQSWQTERQRSMTSTDLVLWLTADVPAQSMVGYAALLERLQASDAAFSDWLDDEPSFIGGLGVETNLFLRIRNRARKAGQLHNVTRTTPTLWCLNMQTCTPRPPPPHPSTLV